MSLSSAQSSPFIMPNRKVSWIMLQVIMALLPGIGLYSWYFGWGVVTNLAIAISSALLWETIMLVSRKRPIIPFISDGSAIVTAILLVLAIPPYAPWWLIVVGTFFAIVVAKHLYGGIGYNPLNPAMAAYAVLLISFPKLMSIWPLPLSLTETSLAFSETIRWVFLHELPAGMSLDMLTGATPLDKLRTDISLGIPVTTIEQNAIFGTIAGKELEWISAAFCVGGLWLIIRRIIQWQIPVIILLSIATIASGIYFVDPEYSISPLTHLLGGATLLCAFFIATDPVTAAATPLGRWIYAAGIGLLIVVIRTWGGYPDGVAFAVILMNLCVPLLDHYTVPKAFGARRDVS